MPDKFGFNHLPHRGAVFHQCIECDEIPWGTVVSEKERQAHHERHVRERARQVERDRKANLAKARKALKQQSRENALAYEDD